ncbi:MAG: ATP12 family protein [Alphaproteobacteria bacterium]|nr:ATP12 family protein [Alphaproteobacteria bacterium]
MSKAKPENKPLPKRFYQDAASAPVDGGYAITLDGKNVRTPQGKMLQCASQQLAQHIAAEWAAQATHIDTETMPLTRLLNIALDRVPLDRAALLAEMAGYATTDLLCYRAPVAAEGGEALNRLQAQHFDPVLDWAAQEHGLHFVLTDGLMPVPQPRASLEKIAAHYAAANDHELAALALMVPILGSALLALALWKGLLTAEEALAAARLDETVHAQKWGEDAQIAAQWAAKARDVRAAVIFLMAHGA